MKRLLLPLLSFGFRWFLGVARPVWKELNKTIAHFDTVPGLTSEEKQQRAEEALELKLDELGYELPPIAEKLGWARRTVQAAVLYRRFFAFFTPAVSAPPAA